MNETSTVADIAVPLAVAAIGAAVAVFTYVGDQLAKRRDIKRQLFAQALADVYKWVEFPYRIARRPPGDEASYELSRRMNDVQESLDFHLAWLNLESAHIHRAYAKLVEKAKADCLAHIQAAWALQPVSGAPHMTTGDYGIDLTQQADRYVRAVRTHLSWWRELLRPLSFGRLA